MRLKKPSGNGWPLVSVVMTDEGSAAAALVALARVIGDDAHGKVIVDQGQHLRTHRAVVRRIEPRTGRRIRDVAAIVVPQRGKPHRNLVGQRRGGGALELPVAVITDRGSRSALGVKLGR